MPGSERPRGHGGQPGGGAPSSRPAREGGELPALNVPTPPLGRPPSRPSDTRPPSRPSDTRPSRSHPAAPPPSRPSGDDGGDARPATLTQQMRAQQAHAMQPPDVARQAIHELDVLARELAALPVALERAGLAGTRRLAYREAMSAYLDLAQSAWEAVAEERLEQTGAEPEYRQQAISVARRLTRLRPQGRTVGPPTEASPAPPPTGGRPWQWRTRTALAREGLRVWREGLTTPADPRRMGEGLSALRGSLGLAGAGGVALLSLRLLTRVALILTPALAIGIALALGAALAANEIARATTLTVATLLVLLVWAFFLLLTTLGPARLGFLLGASCATRQRAFRNGRRGAALVAGFLRVWWPLVAVVGLGDVAAAFVASTVALVAGGAPITGAATDVPRVIGQVGV
ncbi:MAG: hypothetical protein IVW57_14510, partial [Ktedonobacterales bacterium]|nr:hypothetical protein [Ktedonobacterales bacterium]